MSDNLTKAKRGAVLFLSSGFGSGYVPVAPGTAGTAVGLIIVWLTRDFGLGLAAALVGVVTLVGVWASHETGKMLGVPDASQIVIDEVAGFMITMLGVPLQGSTLLLGFVIFRILDIVKIPPANYFDSKVKNGWGVMGDDVVAGIYANGILQGLLLLGSLDWIRSFG